jgi:hypothetical protein
VSRRFDDVLSVLEGRGYVRGWSSPTPARCWHASSTNRDLLVAECVRAGLLDGLDAASLAGLVSVFVYEHRSPEPHRSPGSPAGIWPDRWRSVEQVSRRAAAGGGPHLGLTTHRSPDPTFFAVAYSWAAGEGFAEIVGEEDLSGGDFVRTIRQLIDLTRQLGLVAPDPDTRDACRRAAEQLNRGCRRRLRRGGRVTIRPGEPWGQVGPVPPDLVVVADDQTLRAAAVQRIREGQPRRLPPFGPRSGDLWRSIGGQPGVDRIGAGGDVAVLPLDALRVQLDGEEHWACSHVVARRSWWRGEVVAVMNVQYVGDWDVAPRSHPNDGKLDLVHVDAAMGVRARWQARHRLPLGTHVPHPQILTRQASAVDLVLDRRLPVWLDGELVGEHRHVVVTVVPDMLTVCI